MRSDLVFYIKRMGNQLERMSYQYGQAAGNREISLMNLWVVDFLFDNQDREIFPRDIEEEFSITRATVSKMLNLMEKKELIARKRVEGDGRMPLRYNYDKPEKPRRIKGFEVFSLIFSSFSKPKNHTEISRIAGGVSLTTNE